MAFLPAGREVMVQVLLSSRAYSSEFIEVIEWVYCIAWLNVVGSDELLREAMKQ